MEQKQPWQTTARWLRRGRRQRRIRQYDQGEVTRADGVERQNLRRTSVALTDFCSAIHNRAVGNRGASGQSPPPLPSGFGQNESKTIE